MGQIAATCTAYECSKCRKLFVDKPNANRHVSSDKCKGATLSKEECGLVKMSSFAGAGVVNNHHHGDHIVNNIGNIGHVTILTSGGSDNDFDLVHAGSEEEATLVRKIILENEGLRRAIRTIENAAPAIFRETKGGRGPRRLRNVAKKDKRTVVEFTAAGPRCVPLKEYCIDTTVRMLEHLRGVLATVGPWSPAELREWSADVYGDLTSKKHGKGKLSYLEAVKLYRTGKSTFYKLPDSQDVVCNVHNLAAVIPATARFCTV